MLNKFATSLIVLFLSTSLYAEDQNTTIEDKYAACEKAYDESILKCEDKEDASACMEKSDEELYKCNQKVQELEAE